MEQIFRKFNVIQLNMLHYIEEDVEKGINEIKRSIITDVKKTST